MLNFSFETEARLRRQIMTGDHMYNEKNPSHYFSVGASAMHCISLAAAAAKRETFTSVLDFACGSGRVTRWLKAALPHAEVTASDLRSDSLEWLGLNFGVRTWQSAEDFDGLEPPRPFDLIWCGSLLTHLPEAASKAVIAKFQQWLSPGGVAIVTLHGRKVLQNQTTGRAKYLPPELFEQVRAGYAAVGYGYADYPGRKGLGFSLSSLAWACNAVEALPQARLLSCTETLWDNHHDVVSFQRMAST